MLSRRNSRKAIKSTKFLTSFNMKTPKNADVIIKLLKKEVKDFENPVVSKIGEIQEDPFKVLISCILSLITQDRTTGPVSLK